MRSSSVGRRSSVIPVRVSMFDKDDKNSQARIDSRKTISVKSKPSISSIDSSHIPRSRIRTSSCDRASIRKSTLKSTGKTPLNQHLPTTPITPIASSSKYLGLSDLSRNRSLSGERANNIGARGPRKDTRPLNDKAYQTFMLNKIDKFFHAIQCSSMLNSNGSLKPINLKMFVEVSAFLIKLMDVKQVLTVTNYVEELPKIAKKLHYPGIINKSWLKTANAMHSWPNVLGLLSWLVEVCEIRELAMRIYELYNLPFVGNEKYAEFNRNKFLSMLKLYVAWNDEKLEDEAALVNEYLQKIEIEEGVTEEDLATAYEELEKEMANHRAIEEKSKKIDEETGELKKMKVLSQEDEMKQLDDIKAKEEYIKNINTEIEHMNKEYKILQEQIQLQKTKEEELKAMIKTQSMSKNEKDKIEEECGIIHNYLQQFNEHLEDIQGGLYTLDLKLTSTNNNLSKKMLAYNKEIFMHLRNNIGIDLEELKMPEGGVLKPDIMDILHAKANLMNDVKELLKQQIAEKEQSNKSDSILIENLQKQKKSLEKKYKTLADQIEQQKMHANEQIISLEIEEKKYKKQIDQLKNEIADIQKRIPSTQILISEVEEMTEKLAAVSRRKEYLEESAKLFFTEFYKIIGSHRNELASVLKKHQVK